MYRLLKGKLSGMRKDVVQFTRDLVKTPSESLHEEKAADRVEAKMKELDYDRVVRDEAGNVAGVLFGHNEGSTVLLNSHLDAVAPGNAIAWKHPPYAGDVDGGFLYGRGAADCKGGLAAQVYAGALLKRAMLPLRGSVVVSATVAEENGRSVGVRALMEGLLPSLGLKPDIAILGEPTRLGLYYGHDGWVEIEIGVEGAHPAQVEKAACAIFEDFDKLEVWNSLLDGKRENQAISPPSYGEKDGVRRAAIRFDRRLQQAEDIGGILTQVEHHAGRAAQGTGGVVVKAKVHLEQQRLYTGRTVMVSNVAHAWSMDPFHPLLDRVIQSLSASGCAAKPGRWELGRLGMGTAGGVLVNEFKIPAVGYGPGDENWAHAIDEKVEVEKIVECVYGTAAIVHGLAGVPVFGWTSDDI